VCIVNHNVGAKLIGYLYNFRKLCNIAFHAEYTINHNQLNGFFRQDAELALQIIRVTLALRQTLARTQTIAEHY